MGKLIPIYAFQRFEKVKNKQNTYEWERSDFNHLLEY